MSIPGLSDKLNTGTTPIRRSFKSICAMHCNEGCLLFCSLGIFVVSLHDKAVMQGFLSSWLGLCGRCYSFWWSRYRVKACTSLVKELFFLVHIFFYVLLVFELRKGVIILFFLNLNVIHGIENVIIFADMKLQAVLEMGTVVSWFFR